MTHTYRHPRPAVSVDCAVFGVLDGSLQVLLIQRDVPPFEGTWALPGGFLQIDETLEDAAKRELEEETGVSISYLQQVSVFSGIDRDPRGRVITVAYFALVKQADFQPRGGTDARNAAWYPVTRLPPLAFDHREILEAASEHLKLEIQRQPLAFELLPAKFTLFQLQTLYEAVLERAVDKRNFRKKMTSDRLLVALEEFEKNVKRRPARLYRFDRRGYRRRSAQQRRSD
jgi:8-oxo-dGTP diphosphatase